jgi:hypothetical protein
MNATFVGVAHIQIGDLGTGKSRRTEGPLQPRIFVLIFRSSQ